MNHLTIDEEQTVQVWNKIKLEFNMPASLLKKERKWK